MRSLWRGLFTSQSIRMVCGGAVRWFLVDDASMVLSAQLEPSSSVVVSAGVKLLELPLLVLLMASMPFVCDRQCRRKVELNVLLFFGLSLSEYGRAARGLRHTWGAERTRSEGGQARQEGSAPDRSRC